MSNSRRAGWQLPPGVAPGTWEYVHSESIAKDYDRYFAGHALFALDRELLDRWFEPVATGDSVAQWTVVADLGCGTARGLETLLERGYHGLAVDLSGQMLEVVGEKRARLNWPVMRVRANLVELDGLRDQSLDHAICLFSTLGMVKTTAARRRMLDELTRREVSKAGSDLSKSTGMEHVTASELGRSGVQINRSVRLASGRFAVVLKGKQFALVPWQQAMRMRKGMGIGNETGKGISR